MRGAGRRRDRGRDRVSRQEKAYRLRLAYPPYSALDPALDSALHLAHLPPGQPASCYHGFASRSDGVPDLVLKADVWLPNR